MKDPLAYSNWIAENKLTELFTTKAWGHCSGCGGVLLIHLLHGQPEWIETHHPIWVVVECQDCHQMIQSDIRRFVEYQPGVCQC